MRIKASDWSTCDDGLMEMPKVGELCLFYLDDGSLSLGTPGFPEEDGTERVYLEGESIFIPVDNVRAYLKLEVETPVKPCKVSPEEVRGA